jgi:hypothetical protein
LGRVCGFEHEVCVSEDDFCALISQYGHGKLK